MEDIWKTILTGMRAMDNIRMTDDIKQWKAVIQITRSSAIKKNVVDSTRKEDKHIVAESLHATV